MKSKVIFLEIKKLQEKLLRIIEIAKYHFKNKKKLVFFVSDKKAQKFLDEFLWKEPIFSFLPHSIEEDDIIVISQKNIKKVPYIFNLTTDPIENIPLHVIYEFDDYTDQKRIDITKKKFNFYKGKNLNIESR